MLRMLPPSSSPMEWLERWALSQTGYTTDRDKTFARGTVHADGSLLSHSRGPLPWKRHPGMAGEGLC